IPVDPGQIHQALMNLLTNAVEAVEPTTGVVTVRAHYDAGGNGRKPEATIAVIDNGPGIAPEKAARIFEPFFTTKGLRGTGLGLAVTKRITEQHGGTVEIRSSPGRGAAFTLHLPSVAEIVVDPSQTHHPRLGGAAGPGEPNLGSD
ncbi:MAG: HAMP domain-containing histidine kinase, partial [Phycisphaerae bacterium]|nr:HAMP domain-containing histidine kinase [Phycisphaerae bacterium]